MKMCSFDGYVRDYPEISIDNFTKKNFQSSVYFLSHCHTDHMVGLDSPEFHARLKLGDKPRIYTSEISKLLIINNEKFSHLKSYLETLPLESPTTIQIPRKCSKVFEIVVTVFPAGHCPGSMMILLEGDNGNVLYTGDFRLSTKELAKYKYLHCGINKVKEIKMLYIDATFSTPEALYIPTREDSSKAITALIEPWLATKYHHVRLICSAMYGYEYLFVELYRKFKMKVHVTKSKMQKYEGIRDILDVLTFNPNETRIHACRYVSDENKCEIMIIKLCAMFFAQHVIISDIVFKCDINFYRVCYSLHSSLTEIQEFISYIDPKHLHPLAVPCGYTEKEVLTLLNQSKQKYNSEAVNMDRKEDSIINLGQLVKSKYAEAACDQTTDYSNSEENGYITSEKSLPDNSIITNSPTNSYNSEKELFSSQESIIISPIKNYKRSLSDTPDHNSKSPRWNYEASSSDSESFELYNVSVPNSL